MTAAAAGRLLSDDQRRDWLRLILSENVGPATFRQLINHYGSAADALADLPERARRGGLKRPLRTATLAAAEEALERTRILGARYVAAGEAGYPPWLRFIDGAPPLLCIKGNLELAIRDSVAIVGARNASAIARKFTRQIAAEICEAGYGVVSGLARGIDSAAHEASLSLGTMAVVAGGIDYYYPPENEALQKAIAEHGLLISEMPPGTAPRADHFPRRNRIIAGISRATIIVEAALRSGSLITARFAAEQGRDVFAVPGSPLDLRCEGTNQLLRDGAALLTRASDVIDVMRDSVMVPARDLFLEPEDTGSVRDDVDLSSRERICELLSPAAIEIDDLVRESGCSVAEVSVVIFELELAGRLHRLSDNRVALC